MAVTGIEETLLELLVVFVLAAGVGIAVAKVGRFPYTIALLLAGLGVSVVGAEIDIVLSHDVILLVLLPPLLFEGAATTDLEQFRSDLVPIVALAVPGLLVSIAVLGWVALSCFYTVQPEERAVVKRFGAVIGTADPGLHFRLPFGIDTVQLVPVERVLKEEFGFATEEASARARTRFSDRDFTDESLMLTGDLNIIQVEWVVQYRISDPIKFLYNMREPERTLGPGSPGVQGRNLPPALRSRAGGDPGRTGPRGAGQVGQLLLLSREQRVPGRAAHDPPGRLARAGGAPAVP
jgi:hypothetical protein